MNTTSERVRAELVAETGVDFAEYRDDELIDAVTGWSGLLGLATDLAVGLVGGVSLVVVVWLLTGTAGLDENASILAVTGAVVASVGVAAVVFALRARRRVPDEVTRVLSLSERLADRVAADAAAGRIRVTAGQAARGIVLVAAAPALTRMAQRRFPLIGTLAAPMAGAVLTRVLARAWPETPGAEAEVLALESALDRIPRALDRVKQAVLPKVETVVRWVTLPLLLGGGAVAAVGGLVIALAMSSS